MSKKLSALDRLFRSKPVYGNFTAGNRRTAKGLVFRGVGPSDDEEISKIRSTPAEDMDSTSAGIWWSTHLYHANRYSGPQGSIIVAPQSKPDAELFTRGDCTSPKEDVRSRLVKDVLAIYAPRTEAGATLKRWSRIWTNPALEKSSSLAPKEKSYTRTKRGAFVRKTAKGKKVYKRK